jgi:hypothetical protein
VKGTLIARDGKIVNAMIAERLGGGKEQAAAKTGGSKQAAKKPAAKRPTKGATS